MSIITSTDTKKFYWIKLKTDFFNRAEIDFLLSQPNGFQYIVLYLGSIINKKYEIAHILFDLSYESEE